MIFGCFFQLGPIAAAAALTIHLHFLFKEQDSNLITHFPQEKKENLCCNKFTFICGHNFIFWQHLNEHIPVISLPLYLHLSAFCSLLILTLTVTLINFSFRFLPIKNVQMTSRVGQAHWSQVSIVHDKLGNHFHLAIFSSSQFEVTVLMLVCLWWSIL